MTPVSTRAKSQADAPSSALPAGSTVPRTAGSPSPSDAPGPPAPRQQHLTPARPAVSPGSSTPSTPEADGPVETPAGRRGKRAGR